MSAAHTAAYGPPPEYPHTANRSMLQRVGERAELRRIVGDGVPVARARQAYAGTVGCDQPQVALACGFIGPGEAGAACGSSVQHHHRRAVGISVLIDADDAIADRHLADQAPWSSCPSF